MGAKHVIGIDIGHSTVKVVGLVIHGHKVSFTGCKMTKIDPQYVKKDGFTNTQVVAQVIREALAAAAPRAVKAGAAFALLPESILFRRVLELPASMAAEELEGIVRLEAAEYLPSPLEEMELDFSPLGLLPDGKEQQIMVVAAPRKIVEDYWVAFKQAKLQLQAIDPKPSSLARACIPFDHKEPVILVDIGSETTSISVWDRGMIQVTSALNVGAEVLKDPATGEIDEEKEPALLKNMVTSIVEELEHVSKFYSNRRTTDEIMDIRLSGGGSLAPGVDKYFEAAIDGAKISFCQPIIQVPPFCDRRFLGAIGAALYTPHEAN